MKLLKRDFSVGFFSFCPFTSLISTHRVSNARTLTWDRLSFLFDWTEMCAGCYFISCWLEFILHIYCLETSAFLYMISLFLMQIFFFPYVERKSPKMYGSEETPSLRWKRTNCKLSAGRSLASCAIFSTSCGCLKIWCFLFYFIFCLFFFF